MDCLGHENETSYLSLVLYMGVGKDLNGQSHLRNQPPVAGLFGNHPSRPQFRMSIGEFHDFHHGQFNPQGNAERHKGIQRPSI